MSLYNLGGVCEEIVQHVASSGGLASPKRERPEVRIEQRHVDPLASTLEKAEMQCRATLSVAVKVVETRERSSRTRPFPAA